MPQHFQKYNVIYVPLLGCLLIVVTGVKGQMTNDQQGNNAKSSRANDVETPRPSEYTSYKTASFPLPHQSEYPNGYENLGNNNNRPNNQQWHHQHQGHHQNYQNQNYDNRQNYNQNFARNDGIQTEYRPHHQQYHQQGDRQHYRDENANFNMDSTNYQYDRQYDSGNGNYTMPYYNNYNPYIPPPDQQYYYDPSYNQPNVAPLYGQQNYVYQPQQYYYNQPATDLNNYAYGYNDPHQYGQQQYYHHEQQQYNQDFHETHSNGGQPQSTRETQPSISDTSQSTLQKKSAISEKKSKLTKADAPQPWDPNVHPVYEPIYDDYWYPENDPNNQVQWQPYYPYQNWPSINNLYHQQEQQQQQQQQHNIDWQVFDLNYDEVPFDYWVQRQNRPSQRGQYYQQKTKKIATKQETTERNYNTFGPEELRDLTSTINDSINYNTYSDHEWKELQGIQKKLNNTEEEYAEYETSELEENDSDMTRNYNTLEPTNATTEPTEDINYNTYAPEELITASQPKDINFNTHGNKPYFYTDPNSGEKRYKEYPSTRNASAKPSYHTPLAIQRRYFATAKPPPFQDVQKFPNNVSGKSQLTTKKGEIPKLLDLVVSLTTSTIAKEICGDGDDGNTRSESFLNRWFFGRKHTSKSTQTLPTFNHRSLFTAQSSPSDPWLVESQSTKEGKLQGLLDLVVSPITPTVAEEIYDDAVGDENSLTKSFFNHWLFGQKHSKTNHPPSTFDHKSFFAAPSTSEHWLLSSHRPDSISTTTKATNNNNNERNNMLASTHTSEVHNNTTNCRLIPATPSVNENGTKTDDDYKSIPWLPPLYTHSSSLEDTIVDITTPRLTPATPSSSVDGTSKKINKNQMGNHHHSHHRHHKHNHHTHDHHDQIEVEYTLPMNYQPSNYTSTKSNSSESVTKRKYKRKNKDSQLHLNSSHNEGHHIRHHHKQSSNTTKKKTSGRSKKPGARQAREIASGSDNSSPKNESSPLDVSNAQDYCAWVDQQKYLQSLERRAKEDRQHQKFSRRPLFSQFSFRSINPEYMKTPFWTGSTSYVWMPGGKKKKVIDLPDESYGLLIEDSEEWWQAQRREAKRLRAFKHLGLNREGYRRSRLQAQEEKKRSKIGRLFSFIKNIFQRITGTEEKEEDQKQPDYNDDHKNWDKNERSQNYRQQRHKPRLNYNNQNYRHNQNNPDHNHHPDQNYRNPNVNYNSPSSTNADQNYHRDMNQNNQPRNDDNQKNYRNENKNFNYKPFHDNYNNPDNPDNKYKKPNHKTNYRQGVNNMNSDDPQYNYPGTTIMFHNIKVPTSAKYGSQ